MHLGDLNRLARCLGVHRHHIGCARCTGIAVGIFNQRGVVDGLVVGQGPRIVEGPGGLARGDGGVAQVGGPVIDLHDLIHAQRLFGRATGHQRLIIGAPSWAAGQHPLEQADIIEHLGHCRRVDSGCRVNGCGVWRTFDTWVPRLVDHPGRVGHRVALCKGSGINKGPGLPGHSGGPDQGRPIVDLHSLVGLQCHREGTAHHQVRVVGRAPRRHRALLCTHIVMDGRHSGQGGRRDGVNVHDTRSLRGGKARLIAHVCGDGVVVLVQQGHVRWRHHHGVFAIRPNWSGVVLPVEVNGHNLACLDIGAASDRQRLLLLNRVDQVISGDHINANGGRGDGQHRHHGSIGPAVAIGDGVLETGNPVEVADGREAHGSVWIQNDRCVLGVAHCDDRQGVGIQIGVVGQYDISDTKRQCRVGQSRQGVINRLGRIIDRCDIEGDGVGCLVRVLPAVGSAAIVLHLEGEAGVIVPIGIGNRGENQLAGRDVGHRNPLP